MSNSSRKTDWRTARDPKTGRDYYYNKVTKESTWTKPIELASDQERYEMERKKRETTDFFKEMEKNIFRNFEQARKKENDETLFTEFNSEEMYEFNADDDDYHDHMDDMLRNSVNSYRDGDIEDFHDAYYSQQRRGSMGGIRLVRTISSIDDDIMEMSKRKSGTFINDWDAKSEGSRSGGVCSPSSPFYPDYRRGGGVCSPSNGIALIKAATTAFTGPPTRARGNSREAFQNMLAKAPLTNLKRRNSTGTLYIDSTMSQQDNKATMRCVCAVIRAHMIDAEKEGIVPRPQFDIFKDEYFVKLEKQQKQQQIKNSQHEASPSVALCAADKQLPSLSTIVTFFQNTFSKSQMESECIIMSLIYIERLIKVTKGRFCLRFDNWRSTSFACMIMASKVWDDLSMWNVDFSQISESFDLQRINELELAMLEALNYEVKVPAGEYAKYYFHLRSMIARLGYHRRLESELRPLNIEGARKLQLATEEYAENKLTNADDKNGETRTRSRTVAHDTPSTATSSDVDTPIGPPGQHIVSMPGKIGRFKSEDSTIPMEHQRNRSVLLEHLLHATHIHGDGQNSVEAKRRNSDMNKAT